MLVINKKNDFKNKIMLISITIKMSPPNIDFLCLDKNHKDYKLFLIYLEEMSDVEKKALHIAHQHLGSSFNLSKSNGFVKWKATHKLF